MFKESCQLSIYLSVGLSTYLPTHLPVHTPVHLVLSYITGEHDITSINILCKVHEIIHISTRVEMCIISECCSKKLGSNAGRLNVFLSLLLPNFSSSNILCTPHFLNEMLLYFVCRRCLLSLQIVKWDSSFIT